jgi:cold shock protein
LVKSVLHGALARADLSCVQGVFDVSQGTIKKVMDKGFGFIEGERGDIFFHSSAVVGTSFDMLREGQQVEYSEGRGPKGPCAENVKIIS